MAAVIFNGLPGRAIAMQKLSDFVRLGYTQYVSGTTSPKKLRKTVEVFELNYLAFIDRNQCYRRKRKGLGNVHAVIWINEGVVHWWLLAKTQDQGKHPAHDAHNLRDALSRDSRIQLGPFELVRLPSRDAHNPRWTWRIHEDSLQEWRTTIVDAVRSRSDFAMTSVLNSLWRFPGFRGIRRQIGQLVKLYRAEVVRASLKNAPLPPTKLYYLRRIHHHGLTLKQAESLIVPATSAP